MPKKKIKPIYVVGIAIGLILFILSFFFTECRVIDDLGRCDPNPILFNLGIVIIVLSIIYSLWQYFKK